MINLIISIIKVPKIEKMDILSENLEKYYKKNPRNKAIDIVAALLSKEYIEGYNIDNLIGDFLLVKDKEFINAVKNRIKSGGAVWQVNY